MLGDIELPCPISLLLRDGLPEGEEMRQDYAESNREDLDQLVPWPFLPL